MQPPPCLTPGQPLNHCAATLYAWHIEGRGWLTGAWRGWRIVGTMLVSPDRQKVTPDRLRLLLSFEAHDRQRERLNAAMQRDEPNNI